MTDSSAFLIPVAVYALGALAAPLDRFTRCATSHLIALIAGLIGLVIGLQALLDGSAGQSASFAIARFAVMSFRLDPLSAYFMVVLSVIGVAASLYAVGYLRHEHGPLALLGGAYNGFLAVMLLVVVADNVFSFLFTWELMSLLSFFLVVYHHQQDTTRRAGYVYLVMTHASTAFLMVAFLALFAATGSFNFADMRAAAGSLSSPFRDLVFLLALVAFATKAGVIPLHVWLPRAHPAAPSHVSALMSGVMIKIAIYGLLRVGWDLLGPNIWWGGLLLALGVVSAVLGVLYALMEHDLKRLLAYHSVENIGIILIGLGAAFLLYPLNHKAAASLALLAALYHVLNHAVFKALLFLGAGAVQQATGTRDLEALGGLIRRMPWTAATFLVGAAAISALPPLNGFVSEWLTFQSLLNLGALSTVPAVSIGAAAAAALLALTGGLAAFCFVKAFGIAFLGMPRSVAVDAAVEAGRPMLLGMGLLAALCFFLGLFPTVVVRLVAPVTAGLAGALPQPSFSLLPPLAAPASGSYAPLALLALLLAGGGLVAIVVHAISGRASERMAPPWGCGIDLEPKMQYSATALAKPVRIIFRKLIRPYREIDRQHALSPYVVSGVRYEAGVQPIYERYFYRPAVRSLLAVAERVRALQNGSLRTYLAYICFTLVVLLLLAR